MVSLLRFFQPTANWLYEELEPYFERLEICGSLRRKKELIGDIEFLGISKKIGLYGQNTLFNDGEMQHIPDLLNYIRKYSFIKGNKPQSKFTSFVLPAGIQVDLFFAREDNWGYIKALRTGPSDFNQYFLIPKLKINGYTPKDGMIWKNKKKLDIPDEESLFKLINSEVIPPELRSAIAEKASNERYGNQRIW